MKKILSLIAISAMTIAISAHAADHTTGLEDFVSVTETKYEININARIFITGELCDAEIIPGITYGEAFIEGVTEMWEGSYQGRPVTVNCTVISDEEIATDPALRSFDTITVNISSVDSYDDYCHTPDRRNVFMFDGDGRFTDGYGNFEKYSYEKYKRASGHEFGHALGLGEVNGIVSGLVSCMNDPFVTGMANITDYYFLLSSGCWKVTNFEFVPYSTNIKLALYHQLGEPLY